MKTKLFIDFDKTLFDTSKLKEQLVRIFGQFGFSQEEIDQSYLASYLGGKYSPEGQAQLLNNIRPFNLEVAELKIKSMLFDSSRLLYSDSVEFLDNINREKYEVDLLSYGDVEFNNRKVKHAGIADKFDNIYITNIEKQIYLKDIVKQDENFIMIDDKIDILEKISADYRNAFMIYINRNIDNISKNFHFKGARVRNLKQALEYL
jgi:FMN phosphatase YigB (HAD superfamily)